MSGGVQDAARKPDTAILAAWSVSHVEGVRKLAADAARTGLGQGSCRRDGLARFIANSFGNSLHGGLLP